MIFLDDVLAGAKTVAIGGHVRPDGDCVGSCLAVYNYIKKRFPEMKATVYLEPLPRKLQFLAGAAEIVNPKEAPEETYDLFIALDCGDAARLGESAKFFSSARKTLCVDHHKTNESFADVNEIHPAISSTCELVYGMLPKEAITKEMAECLYLGIAHDTGVFQYSNTSPETMRIAGELMGFGIDYPRIVDETYYIRTYAQQKIWGKAFLESKLHCREQVISSRVYAEDLKRYGAMPGAVDGIVSQLRSTVGVEVSILLYEIGEEWKISLRSASKVDVAKIAAHFGGGGHARAAGATAAGDPDEILKTLLRLVKEELKAAKASA